MQPPAREVMAAQAMQVHNVYGLTIQDARLARLTRRVLCIVIVTSILIVANSVWTYAAGQSGEGRRVSGFSVFVSLGIALLVPCCGYWGAKNNDKNLTCCFCGCNALGGCLGIFTLIASFLSLQALHYVVDTCHPGTPHDGCPTLEQWQTMCPDLQEGYTAQECYAHLQSSLSGLDRTLHLSVFTTIPTIVLQCLSFVWGKRLHDELSSGQVIHQAPPFVTQAAFTQPLRQ